MRKKTIALLILTILAFSIFPFVPNTKAQGTSPTVSLSPSTTQVTQVNQYIYLNVTITDVQNLWAWTATVTWDPTALTLIGSPTEGSFLQQAGTTEFIPTPAKNQPGAEVINDAVLGYAGASGNGDLATIEFQVIGQTSTTVQLGNITIEGPPPSGSLYGTSITLAATSSSATITFVSGGVPAADAGPDQTVTQGTTVTFDGSKSLPSSITSYSWNFVHNGANESLTGVNPTFAFNLPGIYVVTLIATDANGPSTPTTVTITVNSSSKPIAVIAGVSQGQSVPTGQPITLSGTGSSEPNNGTIAKYLWGVNLISQTSTAGKTSQETGGALAIGSNATVTYTFSSFASDLKSETYNITLTVFDATNQNNTATTQITVVRGTGATSTPTATSSTTTSTPGSTSTSGATSSPTPASTSDDGPQAGLPPEVIAITVIITILALCGSTIWLRKRT